MKTSKYLARVSLFFLLIAVGCGLQTDDGLCPLECSGSIVSAFGPDSIRATGPNVDFGCDINDSSTQTFSRPVLSTFLFVNSENIPLPRQVFTPTVAGVVDGCRTDPENGRITTNNPNSCSVDPYRFAGITTPKSQWCSDSCGVATVEFWPVCVGQDFGANAISVTVSSGAVQSDANSVTITDSPDEEEGAE